MNYTKQIIKDPVYGSMSFNAEEFQFLKPFIDHPLFQRLRHIKQLSFVDLIFPGAVHTRFNHSLGVSYLCSRIYKQLHPQETALNDEHKLIIVAGLLHDIGHGPFSHDFEHVGSFKNHGILHEDWFEYFVKEMFVSIEVEGKQQLYTRLLDLFSKDYSGKPWLKSVISSQIDADRMDYILRDSLYCGVKYGEYDLEWLLSCLSLDSDDNLVITGGGIGSAEQFLHARQLMHNNVYYNIKSNAVSNCVIDFLDSLVNELGIIEKILPDSRLIKFIRSVNKHKDAQKQSLMSKTYNEYKMLVDYDIWYAIREIANNRGDSVCHELARRLYKRNLPATYRVKPSSINFINDLINKSQLQPWQIKIVTDSVCFYTNSVQPVLVVDSKGATRQLQESSETIANVSNQLDSVCFLYIDREAYNSKSVKNIVDTCKEHDAFFYD